ncbi:MAG: protein kinase [Planctomycetes bacterium]|nr:protein kinase [Planctomycetota bacterium]
MPPPPFEILLSRLAVETGACTQAQSDECAEIHSKNPQTPLGAILIQRGILTEDGLQKLFETQRERASKSPAAAPARRQDVLLGRIALTRQWAQPAHINAGLRDLAAAEKSGLRTRLARILVDQGVLTEEQVREAHGDLSSKTIFCDICETLYNVPKVEPGKKVRCRKCACLLTTPQKLLQVTLEELLPEAPASEAELVEASALEEADPSAPVPGVKIGHDTVYQAATQTSAPPETLDPNGWFVADGQQPKGPFSPAQIRNMVARKQIEGDRLVWRQGMAQWLAAKKVPDLAAYFAPASGTPIPRSAPQPPPGVRAPKRPTPAPMLSPQEDTEETYSETMVAEPLGEEASEPLPKVHGYILLKKLGEGGMGHVYKGIQLTMDRPVAIKILKASYAKTPKFVNMFLSEARAAAKLNHPNIVLAIDVQGKDGVYYFAMEFVDGPRVADLLERGGALDQKRAAQIVLQITRALEHAHKHGIVHRDIKPQNIMLTKDGIAKLCDLGLAKIMRRDPSATAMGDILGTPSYIAPEQVKSSEDVDTRTDIYSLGASFYHMVTGSPPFTAASAADVMVKHLTDRPVPPMERNELVSPRINAIILKMMARHREERYQMPEELARELDAAIDTLTSTPAGLGGQSTVLEVAPIEESPKAAPKRRPHIRGARRFRRR